MSKSISARILSNLLQFWPKLTAEESEEKIRGIVQEGEKTTPPPKNIVTRYEDNENGRVFYANEKNDSRYIVFYIHGGAYLYDFIAPHWIFIEKLIRKTNALVVAPAYRLIPFGTYREGFPRFHFYLIRTGRRGGRQGDDGVSHWLYGDKSRGEQDVAGQEWISGFADRNG